MGRNDVKYLFWFTCQKIGESVLVSTEFSKKIRYDGKNNVKVLRHKVTIGN